MFTEDMQLCLPLPPRVIGLLPAWIHGDEFVTVVDRWRIHPDGTAEMVDASGNVLYHSLYEGGFAPFVILARYVVIDAKGNCTL